MRLLRRVRALSFHFGLSPGFDLCLFVISCFHFSCFYFSMLLLLFFRSLVRLASLSSFFSNRARRHGMSCVTPRWSCGALPGLAALGSVARRSSASPGSAPMRVWFEVVLWEVLHSVTHAHHFSKCEMYRSASMLPVIDLAPRGEDGMVASVEETAPSASSTSLGRHSAALPIVGPPRGLLARVSREGKSFSGFSE